MGANPIQEERPQRIGMGGAAALIRLAMSVISGATACLPSLVAKRDSLKRCDR